MPTRERQTGHAERPGRHRPSALHPNHATLTAATGIARYMLGTAGEWLRLRPAQSFDRAPRSVRWIETCDGPVNPGAWMIAATRRVTLALPDIRPIPTRTTPAFRPSCYAGNVTCSAGNVTCSAGNLTCYDIESDLLCKAISLFDTMAGPADFPAIAL